MDEGALLYVSIRTHIPLSPFPCRALTHTLTDHRSGERTMLKDLSSGEFQTHYSKSELVEQEFGAL